MLIDWFTVFAQAVNFLILVWLLKKFLYKPVLQAIDDRQNKIAEQLKQAAEAEAKAEADRKDLLAKMAEIEGSKQDILAQAASEAAAERAKILDSARAQSVSMGTKMRESLNSEMSRAKESLTSDIQKEVLAVARRALSDLADVSLEDRMAALLSRRVQAMSPQEKSGFAGQGPVTVISSAELGDSAKSQLLTTLQQNFSTRDVRFETSLDADGGIEILSGGKRLNWNVSAYLSSLESKVGDLSTNGKASGERK